VALLVVCAWSAGRAAEAPWPTDAARARLEQALAQAAARPVARVVWARPIARPAKGPSLVLFAGETATAPAGDPKARREGVLALATLDEKGAAVRDRLRTPLPDTLTWTFPATADLDGDGQPDAVAEWEEAGNGVRRSGIAIARTAPPGLTFIELAGPRQTDRADVACFVPVDGQRGRALVIQRRTAAGGDALQVLLPLSDGHYGDGRVYAALIESPGTDKDALARWRDVFSIREPDAARARQSARGACPAPGILLRSGAVGGRADGGLSILGPLAVSAPAVEQAVRRLGKRAPRALLVIAVGE
jgi:hypothetical protein